MKWKLLLLKILIQSYPIMFYYKIITEPLAFVVTNRKEAISLANKLSSNPVIITPDTSKEAIDNAINYTNSNCILVIPQQVGGKLPRSDKFDTNITKLLDAPQKGVVVLFAFEREIPERFRSSVTEILIDDAEDSLLKENLFPIDGNNDILTAFREFGKISARFKGYQFLGLSAAFLYPILYKKGKIDIYPEIVRTAELWAQEIEQLKDIEGIVDVIIEQLSDYLGNNAFELIVDLSSSTRLDESKIDEYIYRKKSDIYLSSKKFSRILKDMRIPVSFDAVKTELKQRGILKAGNGSTGFTAKMSFYNEAGKFKRHQMILLDALQIEVEEGTTLADIIL